MSRDPFQSRLPRVALVLIVALAASRPASLQAETPDPARPNTEARRWFADAKFGLFVHWGLYSLVGKGEWVMDRDKLPIGEYEKLPARFNPTEFDADAWVKTVDAAGMKYVTITAKHHDGFCLFDSKQTRYDIVDATPYGKDPLKALADACHRHGIKLFFYYSLLDWHHPDYFPRGKTGQSAGREETGEWQKYVAYYQAQIRELCTNYGAIGGLWFDGSWDKPDADWDLAGTYKIVHDLQPGALVGNNHHLNPLPGEDFQVFEDELSGPNKARPAATLPFEIGMTVNRSRGYNARDKDFKTPEQIIRALLGAAGRGANLLLNVGPKPDGTLGPELTDRLLEVGKWLDKNGESVYGTRRGPVSPQPWGVSVSKTEKPGPPKVYLHVTDPAAGPIKLSEEMISFVPRLFGGSEVLKTTQADGRLIVELPRLIVELPEKDRTPIDTIIVLSPKVLDRDVEVRKRP